MRKTSASRITDAGLVAALAVSIAWLASSEARGQRESGPTVQRIPTAQTPPPPVFLDDHAYPTWPLAAEDKAYGAIDGVRLKRDVMEQTTISRRSQGRGEQWWGRIIGMPADAESAEWMAQRLRQAGVADVRIQQLDLPPQWIPQSWEVVAASTGSTLKLESAQPGTRTSPTPQQGLDLEVVYVGLGLPADYVGRMVRGKAVLIHSVAMQNAWQHGAQRNGSVDRAVAEGAAAVLVAIGMPGNRRTQTSFRTPDGVPGFALGGEDGDRLREMIEQAPAGQAAHVRIRLTTAMVPGLKTANVWGTIPGTTDEDIMIVAHRDGYFEAANDNATGVASAIGLAEYFAKVPKARRRRTIRIVGTPGHHNSGAEGIAWMAENRATVFAKTALLINAEHTAAAHVNLYGARHRATNMPVAFHWFVGVGPKFEPAVFRSWDSFGVPRYTDRDLSPAGEIGRIYGFAPSLQLIEGGMYYHTDLDSLETIPPSGLASSTRSYAKIIDEINKLDRKDLVAPRVSGVAERQQ